MERYEFAAAKLDASMRRAFAVGVVVALLFSSLIAWRLVVSPSGPIVLIAGSGGLLATLAVLAYAWATIPRGYVVEGDCLLVVRRGLPDRVLHHDGRAERHEDAEGLRSRRMFMSGWQFWDESFLRRGASDGRIFAAVTDHTRAVAVAIPQGTAFVSPVDPEGLIVALSRVGQRA